MITICVHRAAPKAMLAIRGALGWLDFTTFARPWDGTPCIAFFTDRAPDPKTLARTNAIDVGGALVVRRSKIEKILAKSPVVLRPVAISSRKAGPRPAFDATILDEDFCVVDPLIEIALDRRSMKEWAFKPEGVGRERAIVIDPGDHAFGADRAPREEIFRAHELPSDVWVSKALHAKLVKALGTALVVGRSAPSPSFVSAADPVPLAITDAAADDAAMAYFAARGRAPTKTERAKILASARHAHLLARGGEGPKDDTRIAACTHPFYAYVYARDVDRGGRDDTRKAASKHVETAIRYAVEVDRAASTTTRAALRSSYRLGEYDERLAALAPAIATVPTPLFHAVALKGHANAWVHPPKPDDLEWGLPIADRTITVDVQTPSLRASAYAFTFHGPWVLERKMAEAMFEGVTSVALRKTTTLHKGKPTKADLVFVDVLVDLPLDRDAAGAAYSDPKRKWSSVARVVTDVRVIAPAGASLMMARVTEFPGVLVASADLVLRWKKLRAPFRDVPAPQSHLSTLPLFAPWDEGPPFPKGAAPVEAFRAVLAGDLARRKEAIAHPSFAYSIARLVDRAPKDDTRRAAILHPHAAALYARFVDGAPRPDTRAAAARSGPTAWFYAKWVDGRKIVGPIAKAFAKHELEL